MMKAALPLLLLGACDMLGMKDPAAFDTVDLDGDDQITAVEMNTWGREQGLFESLGGDTGRIDALDLADGLYTLWNVDGGNLTEAEWTQALGAWFPDAEAGQFGEWDLDGSGELDQSELRAGFAHTRLADAWDTDGDGNISENEVYDALYRVFDGDGDQVLTQNEWNAGMQRWGWDL